MYRLALFLLVCTGLLLGSTTLEAKGGKGERGRQQLVNRILVGAGWQRDAVPVINRSSYDRASIEYAAQLWATTSAPRLEVQHESSMLCSDVKPIRHAIILCDAEPWTGPSTSGIAGFTANYTQPNKRGMRAQNRAIQASVIWLYQPRWTDEAILRYVPSHELGHALGLGEMHCRCVMTPIVSDIDVLGSEERAAVNSMYS